MIPYVMRIGDVTKEDRLTLIRVVQTFYLLPNDATLTCHSVARVLVMFAPLFRVIDGRFNGFPHSWLQKDQLVIDPYPWAGVEPFMVSVRALSPWRTLYRASPLEADELQLAKQAAANVLVQLTAPPV